jgi:hypothetical protein
MIKRMTLQLTADDRLSICHQPTCRECKTWRRKADQDHPCGVKCYGRECRSCWPDGKVHRVKQPIEPEGWDYEVRYAREGMSSSGAKLRGVTDVRVRDGFLYLEDAEGDAIGVFPIGMQPVAIRLTRSGPEDAVPTKYVDVYTVGNGNQTIVGR